MSNFQASFQLSDNVDQNKVFLVNLSDIEGRIDPQYYFAKNRLELVNKTVYPVEKISHVLSMQRGRFGHRPRNDPAFYGGEYPFIQTGDIVKANLRKSKIGFNQTLNEKGLKTSRLFDEKVVVFTIAANIGYTAILDYPACFPDSLIAMKPKSENVLLEYINIYLSIIRKHIESLAPQAAQKNINYQQLSLIPFIIPPVEVQSIIFEINNRSVATYKTKISKAQNLLNSVDDYLLAELGIKVPDVDNSLPSRMFTVQASELSGGRFDAYRNKVYFQELQKVLENHTNGSVPLKKYTKNMASGQWGVDEEDGYDRDIYTKCLVIRATEFDNNGNLSFDENRIKYRLIENNKLKKMNILEHDLLIEKSGGSENQPVGRIAILTKNILNDYGNIAYSNFVQKITVNSTAISPVFLFYYLKTLHNIKFTEKMQSQTNGIRNLITSEYLDTPIINVDCQKQHEIVQHIDQIRATAAQLQQEANEILAQAKQKIERMILGEEN